MLGTDSQVSVKRTFLMEKVGYYLAPVILMAVDYIAILCALFSSKYIRDYLVVDVFKLSQQTLYLNQLYVWVLFPLVSIAFIAHGQMYTKRIPFWQSAEILFKACIYSHVLVILISYCFGTANNISRFFMITLWLASFFDLCLFRQLSKKLLMHLQLWQRPVVIVGAGKTAELIAKTFENEPGIGYKIVGLVEDNYTERPLTKEYPHIGTFDKVEEAIQQSKVRDVIIATPGLEREKLVTLMQRIQPHVRNLTIVPDLFGIPMANIEAEPFIDDRLVMLKTKNNLEMPINKLIKRMFDLFVGSIISVGIIPLLLLITIWIKLDSKGPVLHVAKRIGKDQKTFACYKFRTMHVQNHKVLKEYLTKNEAARKEWQDFAKLRDYDPRVTRVGRWLRKYSLDELPQFLNVISGSMSLVGPRPYLPKEKKKMGYYILTISQTVPGITGLWQVSGRNNIKFEDRLKLDDWYVRNWSVWQDIILLLKTIKVVLKKDGAY